MNLADIGLVAIRASGAVASALAGVAALLTDGAFERRATPLRGWLKNFPIAKYRITAWGSILLTIILIAPGVQLLGDLEKDEQDQKTLTQTAEDIKADVDQNIGTSTKHSQDAITKTVSTEGQQQLVAAQKLFSEQAAVSTTTNKIATSAEQILRAVNESLYPFTKVTWAYEIRIDLANPKLLSYRNVLRQKGKEIFNSFPLDGDKDLHGPGDSMMGPTGYTGADTFQRFGQEQRLLIHIDSPLLPKEGDPALSLILGYKTLVDIFKIAPLPLELGSPQFRSPDYAVTLLPPYGDDTYEMRKAGSFEPDNSRFFELIYIPANGKDVDSDELLVDYYWHALATFDVLAERTDTSINGLPDLGGSSFVVRLAEERDLFKTRSSIELESLRMDVGDRELFLSASDFGPPTNAGDFLVYRLSMPGDFSGVLRMFDTVRSQEDQKLPVKNAFQ